MGTLAGFRRGPTCKGRESLERAIVGVLVGINVRSPYIVRQKLYTDIREDIMSGEPDQVADAIEKIVIFNETYKSETQPSITVKGLTMSIRNEIRKELKDYIEKQIEE